MTTKSNDYCGMAHALLQCPFGSAADRIYGNRSAALRSDLLTGCPLVAILGNPGTRDHNALRVQAQFSVRQQNPMCVTLGFRAIALLPPAPAPSVAPTSPERCQTYGETHKLVHENDMSPSSRLQWTQEGSHADGICRLRHKVLVRSIAGSTTESASIQLQAGNHRLRCSGKHGLAGCDRPAVS